MIPLSLPANIKKLVSSPQNIVILSVSLLIIIVILNFLFNKTTRVEYRNQESIVAPNELDKTNTPQSQNYFEKVSITNAVAVERYVYNWMDLFELFASNPENQKQRYAVNPPLLEKLSQEIKSPVFYKGSSDEVLKQFGEVIKEECKYYNLDYRLILAMIKQESAFNSVAVSHAGAYGFMQIMPRTGSVLEQALQLEEHHSPKNNLIAGIYYYATLVGRYNSAGDTNKYKFALAAYNAGSGHVEDAMSIAYYYDENYLDWDYVKERMKQLAPGNDSIHKEVWNGRPPNGVFANWKEPYNYVDRIMYFWDQYKIYYPEPEDKKKKGKNKKKVN